MPSRQPPAPLSKFPYGAADARTIALMHVGSNPDDQTTYDANALPELIIKLRDHGYSFVTLAALVG